MAVSSIHIGTFLFLLLASQSPLHSRALVPYSKAISDLREATVKSLGLQSEDLKVSGFDIRDAKVGHSVSYEFDVEIDNKVLPFKLLEDIKRWDYADLPIFRVEDAIRAGDENGIVEKSFSERNLPPVLAPFQLAGPMELWIQDAKDMRVSLPHDVDAGVLKKIILAEGAVVTVKGARSVSLRHPLDLPLPLNRTVTAGTGTAFASGLLALAKWLHLSSRSQTAPILSLRIVGPTSIASPSSPSSASSSSNRLKLKRLAPGLVELSSASLSKPGSIVNRLGESTSILSPTHFTTTNLWPLVSVNGSEPNLVGFEKLLAAVLGPKADEKGSFRLLKADVSAQTFVKIGFSVEKKLVSKEEGGGGEGIIDWSGFPSWRTRPENVKMHFEVLAKVDGEKIVQERVVQVNPFVVEDTVAPEVLSPNVSVSRVPIVYPPPDPFAL